MRLLLLACLALLAPWMAAAAQPPADSAAAILMYHRFGENALPSTSIRLEQLDAHITELVEGGYTVLPLPEIVAALHAGRPLPPRTVAITVDDAYASFVAEGWPRFRRAGLPVTWFVNTEPVEKGYAGAPTWDDIRRLRDEGVTIGAHSHAHPSLPALGADARAADLEHSLAVFERELGTRPALFAYPYGEADADTMALVEKLGFTVAFGQHSGVAWAGDDRWYLPRFAMNENYGAFDRFRRVVNALPLPATDVAPADPTLRGTANPPTFAFTVTDPALRLDRLACYGPDGALAPRIDGRRVEVPLVKALPAGRTRVNCTLPGPAGADGAVRWHWRGTLFLVLPQAARKG